MEHYPKPHMSEKKNKPMEPDSDSFILNTEHYPKPHMSEKKNKPMEPDSDSFILIFDELSESQKSEALRKLREYLEGDPITRERIVKESEQHRNVHKMDVGPTTRVCTCCGR